jgi:hypothetical protein
VRTKKEVLDSMLRSDDYKNIVSGLSPEDKKKFNELLSGEILPLLHSLEMKMQINEDDNLDYSEGE